MPAQHILGGLKAPEEREQRGCWSSGRAWRFGGPMRSITHGLSSVPAATYVFVESSDWSSSPSAIVAVANQPKICCAHHSAIGIAAFPIGRVQHASSQMSFPVWNHTQHSSERTIGRHMLRATYGDLALVWADPIGGPGHDRIRPRAVVPSIAANERDQRDSTPRAARPLTPSSGLQRDRRDPLQRAQRFPDPRGGGCSRRGRRFLGAGRVR